MVNKKLLTLDNNLKILFIPRREVESVTVQLKGRAGSNFENNNQIGAAHLLEHLVLKGTKKFPNPKSLTDYIINEGGSYYGVTSRETVAYGVKILKDDLEKAFVFLSEIFFYPTLDINNFEIQKKVIFHEINRFKEDPKKLIFRLANKTLFPFSRMSFFNTGDTSDLESLKYQDVINFRNRTYFPANFIFCVCGNADYKSVKKFAYKYLNQTPSYLKTRSKIPKTMLKYPKPKIVKELAVQLVKSEINETYVNINFYTFGISDSRKYPVAYLAHILDNYLKYIIKDQFGLCYSINANDYAAGQYGILTINFNTNEKNVKKIIKNVRNITSSIHKLIDNSKIENIKKSITATYTYSLEKPSQIAGYYTELMLYGNPWQTIGYEQKQYKKVKNKEIHKTADLIFSQKPKITVISKSLTAKKIKDYWNL